ncbi:CinA family protein [Parapedobacter deserti]|uniref:CinA family protein n=1 Tax=Parapedobacter deserti TaxID=1912957 RepID=A0ABV7JJ27_9SPHI
MRQDEQVKEHVENCSALLARRGLHLAFAESATAGALAAVFSQSRDSGDVLKGGVVCYDVCLKEDLLKVPRALIERYTPESMEVTQAMTYQLRDLIAADIHIGVTGLTKPGGSESPEKPVGTMFICLVHRDWELQETRVFKGDGEDIIVQTIVHTCRLLMDKVGG